MLLRQVACNPGRSIFKLNLKLILTGPDGSPGRGEGGLSVYTASLLPLTFRIPVSLIVNAKSDKCSKEPWRVRWTRFLYLRCGLTPCSTLGVGKLSIEGQPVNILGFLLQEAKSWLYCSYLYNKKENKCPQIFYWQNSKYNNNDWIQLFWGFFDNTYLLMRRMGF